MLGEKLGDFRGRIMSHKALPWTGPGAKFETIFEARGTLLGHAATLTGTYTSIARPDGTLYGESIHQGMVIMADGQVGKWSGMAAGRSTGSGPAASYRGALCFDTLPTQLARLSDVALLFEWEVDEQGNAKSPLYEWK
jgi:hypothetical protein